jgi:hypothetical protein
VHPSRLRRDGSPAPHDTEWVYELRTREIRGRHALSDAFDRVAFARRVLAVLRPARVSVAVYASGAELRVERGRAWADGPGAEWAMVAIPPQSSRAEIVYTLSSLAGLAHHPFIVDLLAAMPFEE